MSMRRVTLGLLSIALVSGLGWWGANRYSDGQTCDDGNGVRLSGSCVELSQRSLDTGADRIGNLRVLRDFDRLVYIEILLQDLDGDLTGIESLTTLDTIEIRGDGEVVDLSVLEALPELRYLTLTGFDARNFSQVDLPMLEELTINDMTIEGLPTMANLVRLSVDGPGDLPSLELAKAPGLRNLMIRDAEGFAWDTMPALLALERLTVFGVHDGDLGMEDFTFALGLPNLQDLTINGNGVASDLSPLADLPLTSLALDGLPIRSLDPIAGVTTLESLAIRDGSIDSLRPVASLTRLTELRVSGLEISSLDGIEVLTALEELDVYESSVSDLGPVSDLTNLNSLGLDRSKVSDLTPLAGLTNLTRLSLWGTPVTTISAIEDLPLISIDLNSSQLESVAPLAGTETLESLRIGSTRVVDLSPLVDLPRLDRLVPPEGSGADNRDEVIELLGTAG